MASFDLTNQPAATIPTPGLGLTTVFVDTADKAMKIKDDAGTVTNLGAPGNAITQLTGDVTATGPGSVPATIASTVVTGKVLTGLSVSNGTPEATDTILQAIGKLAGNISCGWYGQPIDGDVVISSNTTLVRDMYYNTLVINPGATLFTAGFRIYSLMSIVNNGTIDRSGNDASSATGATAIAAGTTAACAAGGNGGTTAAGAAGGASATAVGAIGGTGGVGSAGTGGVAGAVTLPTAAVGGIEAMNFVRQGIVAQTLAGVSVTGGSGGGGGGGGGAALSGGGGGGGGGILVVSTMSLTGTGTLRAHGGNGFNGQTATNAGGGGGGGGGVIIAVTGNDLTSSTLTFDVAGGLGGAGQGTGLSGSAGSAGRIFKIRA